MSYLKLILKTCSMVMIVIVLASCKNGPGRSAEPLDMTKAQKSIKDYVRNNGFEHLDELIAASAITKFDPPVTGERDQVSINTHFINEGKTQITTLVFNFDKSVKGEWVLNSVRSVGRVSNELANWLAKKTSLNIPVK